MATELKGTLKRQIRVYGVQAPVNLTITEAGIEMAVPGFKKKIAISWGTIVRNAETPSDVASYLAGKPLEFLKHQAETRRKKNALKEDTVHPNSSD